MALVVEDDNIRIDKLTIGPFDNNCYIITCAITNESVVVDAPAEAAGILEGLKGTHPRFILITHTHMDHLGALSELKSKLGIPVAVHPLDAGSLPLKPEMLLGEGDTVSFGRIELKVLHTPGHTPGSVCFLTGKYLISGDTLFPGGPGKTGSPANLRQIIESITDKIFCLPEDTQVHPGHGDSTILKKEKEEFALFSSRPHDSNLCGDVLWLSS
ncbi:MAG: MBL fold metallo-hydrolase [Candidatus Aenigmarchaeota archaeon]|nr:MBL fold metallo-hydrolase [Candidatus Aenigmarchaeota archaeon]